MGYKIKLGYKEALPVKFIYTDKFLRDVIYRLKNNDVIAMAIDGREGSKWVEIEFLGQTALFSTGVMKLINKMQPVVLPTFVIRQRDNTSKLIISNPMTLNYSVDSEKDIVENTKTFLTLFEKYIRTYPHLYGDAFWLGESFFKNIQCIVDNKLNLKEKTR